MAIMHDHKMSMQSIVCSIEGLVIIFCFMSGPFSKDDAIGVAELVTAHAR